MRTKNNGRNPLLYPDEKTRQDVKELDFDRMLDDGIVEFVFHSIISGLPPYAIDKGVIKGSHIYLCPKGIVMYSYRCDGYLRKIPISFRNKQLGLSESPHYFFCQWSHVKANSRGTSRIIFLNRKNVYSFKKSMILFRGDLKRAKERFANGFYSPMSPQDKVMNDKASDGIYIGDYVYIRCHDKSHHYYYEKWLELRFFTRLVKITLQ